MILIRVFKFRAILVSRFLSHLRATKMWDSVYIWCWQARVAQLVAHWLAVSEIWVQTLTGVWTNFLQCQLYWYMCPLLCNWRHQSCMFFCLQSLGIKGTLHPLPTFQNNVPVPQVIETGCKPVLLLKLWLYLPVYKVFAKKSKFFKNKKVNQDWLGGVKISDILKVRFNNKNETGS